MNDTGVSILVCFFLTNILSVLVELLGHKVHMYFAE